ncbi:MAG: M16 family metallopeptidase [Acidobacteriota bacterium]
MEKKAIASNGVPVYYYKQPNTHSICIALYVKTGSLYEHEHPGISHFLEHLHFRKLGGRTQRELYYELETIGAYLGASTSKEFLQFNLTSAPQYFSQLSRIAADLLGQLEADTKDFTAEKRLILSEIRESEQNNCIDFLCNKHVWENTNLQHPILGTISSVSKLTLPILQNEKEQTFTKNNIFYYISGSFNDDDITVLIKEIERYSLQSRPKTKNDNVASIPANFKDRNAFARISQRKWDMHEVRISFDVDFASVGRRELLYLDSILVDGLCSLLRSELIEKKGLIYSLSSTIEQYRNIGMYYLSFSVFKSNLYQVVQGFVDVINQVKLDISNEDMEATRVFKTDNQLMLLDDPESLNWNFAYENHILENQYSSIVEFADAYRQITKQKLIEITNEVFTPNNAIIVSMGKKKGLSASKLQEILAEGLK